MIPVSKGQKSDATGIKGEIPIKNGKECSENAAVIEE